MKIGFIDSFNVQATTDHTRIFATLPIHRRQSMTHPPWNHPRNKWPNEGYIPLTTNEGPCWNLPKCSLRTTVWNVRFGPLFENPVFNEWSILDSRPTKEGIMADERGNFSIRAAERDTLIDTTRKVGDTVLEVMMRHLHDIWRYADQSGTLMLVQMDTYQTHVE